jgi:hypothetical protein
VATAPVVCARSYPSNDGVFAVLRSSSVLRGLLVGGCLAVVGAGFLILAVADQRGAGMIAFSLSCLAGAVVIPILAMTAWRRRQARISDGDWVLRATLRRTRTVNAAMAVLFLGFAGLLFGVRYLGWDSQAGELGLAGDVVLTLLMIVLVVLGGFAAWTAASMVPLRRTPLLRVLYTEPHRLAWVYQSISDARGRVTVLPDIRGAHGVGQQATLAVCRTDGSRHSLSVESESVPAVVAALTRVAPHLRVGYSTDVERSYRADPAGLGVTGVPLGGDRPGRRS